MPFGLVVTSGLAHMMSNEGEVNLITNQFKLTKLFSLIGMPKSSWKLDNGDLLINSYPSGSQVLTKLGYLKRVECIANKSGNTNAKKQHRFLKRNHKISFSTPHFYSVSLLVESCYYPISSFCAHTAIINLFGFREGYLRIGKRL